MAIEHVDVLIVGAGLSGIGAACHLQTELPGKSYAVLEARDAIGGTWDLFRYPGIRSDSDMFTLGYAFRPWNDAESIADGESIRRYIVETAQEYGVQDRIRFHHRAVAAEWSGEEARWTVTARRTDTDETVQLTCSWLSVCSGYYRYDAGYRPRFEGEEHFRGQLVHPQHWPEDLEVSGRRVVVIGSGATAVTLVPSLAGDAEHVTMLQRTPSYVLSLPGKDPLAQVLRRRLPGKLAYPVVRWKNVLLSTLLFQFSRRRPAAARALIRRLTRKQLPAGFDVDTHFNPPYDPWDQRLCLVPDGDLFRSLRSGKASIVTDRIARFTPTGIALESGAQLDADVIVTATGLDLLPMGGVSLVVDGRPVDISETVSYKGMMISGVPNFTLVIGYTNASWTLKADLVNRYVCRLIAHLDHHGYASATPVAPPEGADEPFLDLASGYVRRSLARLPKQGSRPPWKLHQNYLRDVGLLRRGPLEDEGMTFQRRLAAAGSTGGGGRLMEHYRFAEGSAVVTGAASGIGEALATRLAARGSGLVLVDRDEERLAVVADRLRAAHPGLPVTTHVADLADEQATDALAAGLAVGHPETTLLVNNAGVALGGRFDQVTLEEFD